MIISMFLTGSCISVNAGETNDRNLEKIQTSFNSDIYYVDEESGVKARISDVASKASSSMLCTSYFEDKGQSAYAEKSLELFQAMSFIGNETWSKTVFLKAVADTIKNTLDKMSNDEIGQWCEANIIPIVIKAAEDSVEAYNHRSKYFSFPLRCAQIAMYAFNNPVNQAIADMHLKYVEQRYSWTREDLLDADAFIKQQFKEKKKRYPSQVGEKDLLQMMYASDFSCNEHK